LDPANPGPERLSLFSGAGEMAELMQSRDWAATAVGPVAGWPRSLRTIVQIMLGSRFAMWMAWGPELTMFYNDAYRPTLGVKHPWALGPSAREVWAEIWPAIGPRIEHVLRAGQATWDEGLLLFLERHGYPEETYHTFSYSPIPDDSGAIGGMLCVVTEETERVIGERRLRVLRELAAGIAGTRTTEQVAEAIERCLAANRHDTPFALLYLLEGGQARRIAVSGAAAGHPWAAGRLALDDPATPWPIARLAAGSGALLQEGPPAALTLPGSPWDRPPRRAVLLPVQLQGQDMPSALLIAGLNPYRPFDDAYRGFLELMVGQIAAGLGSARASEEEHRRAEALAELDRAKTAFFSNASHEFRTPLTLMLGPLEEMLAQPAPDIGDGAPALAVDRDELALVHRNGLRLLKLVNTLLDFSRIEAGRVQAVFEPVDLAAATAELASTFRSAMERAGLGYRVACASLPQPVHVDRDMWEKIVLNLLSNAFKYTLEGEVEVTLAPSADGRGAELAVRDTGVGVPPEELPRLFERFHRVEGQRGRTQEGTGIGLALVQELTRLHGGTVRVESEVGRGSRFTVLLPFGTAHLPPERIGAARTQASTALGAEAFLEEALRWLPGSGAAEISVEKDLVGAAPAPAAGRRAHVLVADDNADMRDYVRRLLGERYAVETAADGQAALEAAERRRPDLVVSDVMMPRLDGFGLLAAIRARPGLREVPVILLSARAGEEARVEGLEAGADDYLAKPFSARELLARVATNLELAEIRRAAADALREEAQRLELLNRTGAALAAELELDRLLQTVIEAAVALTAAAHGVYFERIEDGEGFRPMALCGVPHALADRLPAPRETPLLGPVLRGERMLRLDDLAADPASGLNPPYGGVPHAHPPVRSLLAAPVVSRSGAVLGAMLFGHAEPGRFGERDALIVSGIAAQAAIAIDNARLYRASRRAEEALRRLNETLEQRVVEEIAARRDVEEELRQAQKMEAIGQLTGGVAHDFNNLLQVIIGGLERLRRRGAAGTLSPEQAARTSDAAMRAAERAAALTQRLLAFSRRQPLEPKPTDVNRLVAGMSDLLHRTLGESIVIETVLAAGLWRTLIDANQLESALLNLAVNSRDAMPGGGKLTIETANAWIDQGYANIHLEVAPGQYVLVAVSDTGSGMSREVLGRAFEPFFTTKGIGQGTGLGLSQVYGFVKQSGGHVKLYSEPGHGTTVKLYLPRLDGEAAAEPPVADPEPVAAGSRSELILLVEDDPDVRAHSLDMLRELGYRVLVAGDGASALAQLAAAGAVDLLFTDVGLPGGMNGKQLADEARRLRPGLRVLFTTGYARNAIVHHGRLDPGVELLAKPFTFAALADKLRQVLEG
jgi:signal transduction histidine kinase/DNA-binding response OmpR family regulator